MKVNGEGFGADVVTKGGFPAKNSPHNGERVHSLLCGRKALGKPAGAAVHLQTLFYPAFVKVRKKISTRRNFSGCRGAALTKCFCVTAGASAV